jgi:hypothetical protein
MTKLQKLTFIVVISDVVALGAYDVWAATQGGAPATISWLLTWTSQQWWGATAVFALGYLMGHFFAQDSKISLDGKTP